MSRIALTAFSGWNDAGEAATGVLEHLLEIWPSRPAGAVDAEAFIDFQVNRPEIRTTEEGLRVLDWPDTELRILQPPQGPEIVTVMGPEPSLHWKRFCDEVLEQLQVLDVSSVISLGALLADAPHSRPLPVSAGIEPGAAEKVDPVGQYEGPVGVPTILARRTTSAGLRTTSIWVQVPHYVAQNPSPKATLALLRAVQDSISAPICANPAGSPGGLPRTVAVPLVGRIRPRSIRSVVVLPAPFGPSSPNTSPRRTVNEIPRTAACSPWPGVSPGVSPAYHSSRPRVCTRAPMRAAAPIGRSAPAPTSRPPRARCAVTGMVEGVESPKPPEES